MGWVLDAEDIVARRRVALEARSSQRHDAA